MQTTARSPEPISGTHIRSAPCPRCHLCGAEGDWLYRGQRDRLFGAEGVWDLKKCSHHQCGLIWLDPMPLPADLGRAYANYYTHAPANDGNGASLPKRLYRLMKRGYWAGRHGYELPFPVKALGLLFYLLPARRSRMDAETRHLDAVPNGRLLDIGCGSGDWMEIMLDWGWEVEGLDFDENAVKVGRQKGLVVRQGALEDQKYPANSFDAVVLNHVIEHVPDPVATVTECFRILKPGGKLVLFTPNGSSLSHGIFKQDWRGLEPPRHLHIFSTRSLPQVLRRAGFKKISIRPQIAKSVIYDSLLLSRGRIGPFHRQPRRKSAAFLAGLFNFVELAFAWCRPAVADCVGAVATKE